MNAIDPRSKIDAWFWGFAPRLMDRVRRGDWPELDNEFWEGMKRAFIRSGINETVADEASYLMAEETFKGLDGIIPALKAHAKAIFKANEIDHRAELTGGDSDRMRAEMESKNCDRCAGNGLTEIYRLKSAVEGQNNAVTCYCICPAGQLLHRVQMSANEDSRNFARRIVNLADHPDLHGDAYRHDPFAGTREPFDPRASRPKKLAAIGAIPQVA